MRTLKIALCLAVASVSASVACAPASTIEDESTSEGAFTQRNCVIEQPLRSDGYAEILEADASRVSRKVLGADGQLVEDPEKVSRPTEAQLGAAMAKISKHIERIEREVPDSVRRRETYSAFSRGDKPEPYCLFHAAGKAVYGTVVLFHGFNDRPHQQAKLASYLFHAGFNVYNVFLANMYMVEGTEYWPKTVYRPEILALVQAKLASPANQATLQPILPRLQTGALTPEDIAALDAILAPELSTEMLKKAWSDPAGEEFKQLFASHTPHPGEPLTDAARQSDFMEYVRDATARIADLSALPGPVFLGGLSVGGTVALAAAAADGGRRVRGVVSHAPWLQSVEAKNNLQIMLAGPLDKLVEVAGGQYPVRWENHQIGFSPASISADLALGSWTARPQNVMTLARIPTGIVVTDAEDSADNAATEKLHAAFTMDPRVASLHAKVAYPAADNVGHAMTDPENYRNEARYNKRWESLYQESFRFYTTGTLSQDNLLSNAQDRTLPETKCAMRDFPSRCR